MTFALEIVVAALFGAVLGSFLNVVAWRVPRGESIVRPRSSCPQCKAQIAGYDNVPVISWLLLRGRCRHCSVRIPIRYPAVELLTAVVFAAIVAIRGFDDVLLLELPFAAVLIAVAAIDLEHRIVPNKILLPAAVWGLVVGAVVVPSHLPGLLIAG